MGEEVLINMAIINYSNVGISAISACVPKKVINNYEYTQYFPKEDVKKVVDKIGVYERRFVDEKTCSSDLCYAAAEKLFDDNKIDRAEIDLLVFVSQTPDYRMPATSILLQSRLKLPSSTIAFDVNLGCSGFLYGLSIIYSFMQNNGLKKALLLNGETRSKVYSPKDRTAAFIFGDAGVAALIEYDEKFGDSHFSLNSDGSRGDSIMIPGGGYRNMSSIETLKERVVDEHGNIRSDEQGYMKGSDVFNFVIREIPKDIKRLFTTVDVDIKSMDYYIFHQANSFINTYIAKKMKLDTDKIPSTIEKYGNTSGASIPIALDEAVKQGRIKEGNIVVMVGFGAGLTWASTVMKYTFPKKEQK